MPLPSLSEIFSRIRKLFSKKVNKELIKKLKEFAAKDLRKKSNKRIKPLVKMLRKVLKKIGVKFAGKAGKTVSKSSNPVGWILLAVDALDAGFAFNAMLQECKNEMKSMMNNQSNEFKDQIKEILINIYDKILENTLEILDQQVKEANPDIETLLKNKEICNNAIIKFDNAKDRINNLKFYKGEDNA
jgi:hypothetical protein